MAKTPLTEEQKKKRWWGPERNAERRKKYREDAEHRENIRKQVREHYVATRLAQGLEVRDDDCRENIGLLSDLGEEREVTLSTGEVVDMLTFTTEELAQAFDRSQQVLYRWVAAGLLPRPAVLAATPSNRNQPVYTHEEAEAFLNLFGQHQETSQYYRKYHTETRDKLFAAATRIRNSMKAQGVPMKKEEDE